MPYNLDIGKQGYYVVNSETGKRMNKTGLSKSRAKKYMAALYANEDPSEFERKPEKNYWKKIIRKNYSGWFSILKRSKYNLQMMKEAIRRVVDELDGESIEAFDLKKKLAHHYREVVIELGSRSEKGHLNKLKQLNSLKPFLKLMRNYGYEPEHKRGTSGFMTPGGLGNMNPISPSTTWIKR